MSTEQELQIAFGPFRFDPVTGQLMRGERVVALQPKPLAVLQYLARCPGQLVTKQELLKAIWTGTIVTKAVVKECVRAIRETLGEEVEAPHYIETIGREGYRFIDQARGAKFKAQRSTSDPALSSHPSTSILVGRQTELAQLHHWLDKALRGEPQLVFVTGEPGIGKTTIVDLFRERVQATETITLGRGQCIEHYGEGEAYLPVLEALGRLCREAGGQHLIALLRRYAPTWLVQLPGVIAEEELQALRLQVQGSTQQRMLREMAEAIEVGTVRRPLVLIVEDLQWSDHSTLELLAYLAKRRQRARLLIAATYRPIDVVMRAHPLKTLKQELQAHGQCEELRLELLTKEDVMEYVARRFPGSTTVKELAHAVYAHTDGNPLFMVNVVDEFLRQGIIVEREEQWALKGDVAHANVPDTLRQLIEKQIAQLSEGERHVLEVASVAGTEFAAATVAAGLRREVEAVEELCEELAWQGHFLEERGIAEWPDGTVSGRYSFRHALYQNVLYERVAEARRVRLHRLIGEREEQAYGARAGEIAAELAVHFERGHDYHRAVQYLEQAGQRAIERSAHVEAITHLTRGLKLLKTLPDTSERAHHDLTLHLALGAPLLATKGYAAPEVEHTYTRAVELCRQVGEPAQLFPALGGLWQFYLVRADYQRARESAEQLLTLAQSVHDSALLLGAHDALGQTYYYVGEFARARDHLEYSMALYDPQQHRSLAFLLGGEDPGVACRDYMAWTLWMLGYPAQALQRLHEALTLAQELSSPFNLALALCLAAWLHQSRREGQLTQERAEAAMALGTEQGFAFFLALGTILRRWALAEQGQAEEGIAQMRQGLAAHQATGAEMHGTKFLALLAEAYEKVGQTEEGLTLLAEALAQVEKTGERLYEAELYRLKGELTLQKFKVPGSKFKVEESLASSVKKNQKAKGKKRLASSVQCLESEAEECFLKAIEIARRQQAKSLELRATMSLSQLWQQQGKQTEARTMLAEIYGWFTEGFDTKDLQEAKALLVSLESSV